MPKDTLTYTGREQTMSANTEKNAEIIATAAREMHLSTRPEKVSLRDIDRVKSVSVEYLDECAATGVLPTVRGVAARLGISRTAIYNYAGDHPGTEFSKWLEDFSDLCGEITMTAAIHGTVAAIPAIFVAKSRYQWREPAAQVEIGRIESIPTNEELMEKYERYMETENG